MLPRVEAQLGALTVACGCELRLEWIALHGALLRWAAAAAFQETQQQLLEAHSAQVESLAQGRKQLASALLEAEAARRDATKRAEVEANATSSMLLGSAMSVGVTQATDRALTATAFGRWARTAVAVTWEHFSAAVDSSHLASSLRTTRRVGALTALCTIEASKNWSRACLGDAVSRWQAIAAAMDYSDSVHELAARADQLQRRALQASNAESQMRSLADEKVHQRAKAERDKLAARANAGAKVEGLARERDEARAHAKKAEEALLEARGQFAAGKAELRGTQERLQREQAAHLRVAERAQRAQLHRVLRIAHFPSLGAFLAVWRAAAVAEQVARNYYYAASVAGNYYYAQGAAGEVAMPEVYPGAENGAEHARAAASGAMPPPKPPLMASAAPLDGPPMPPPAPPLPQDGTELEEGEEVPEVPEGELFTPHPHHSRYAEPQAFRSDLLTQPTAAHPTTAARPTTTRPTTAPLPTAPQPTGLPPSSSTELRGMWALEAGAYGLAYKEVRYMPPPPGVPPPGPLLAHMPLPVAQPQASARPGTYTLGGSRDAGSGAAAALGGGDSSGDTARSSLIAKNKATRANRRYAALACAVRAAVATERASLAWRLGFWRHVTLAGRIESAAREELQVVQTYMQTAAEGRARTHAALRRAAVKRCVRSVAALSQGAAITAWWDTVVAIGLANKTAAHAAAAVAAAAAAAEVTRLSDLLSRERSVGAARPLHREHELKAGREATHAAELARSEAEAKLRELSKSAANSEAMLRNANERVSKLEKQSQREQRIAAGAARAAALRAAALADGRWCVPRALERWRALLRPTRPSAAPLSPPRLRQLEEAAEEAAAAGEAAAGSLELHGASAASRRGLGTPSMRRQRPVTDDAGGGAVALATAGARGGLPLPRLLTLSRLLGRWASLHAAYVHWRGVALAIDAVQAAETRGERRGVEERKLTRLRAEAESERKRCQAEKDELLRLQAGWARSYKLEQGHVATEATRGRKLALRAAATLLTLRVGATAQCGVALRQWRLSVLQLGAEAYVRRLRSASRVTRLESLVCGLRLGLAHLWCSLALQRWRKVVVALAAEAVLEAERVRTAHIARMLEGARGQLTQRTKLPLKLEEDLSASRAALESELLRAKEATNAQLLAQRQSDAAKAQRDSMESALRRTEAQLRALQRERSRRVPTADQARVATVDQAAQAGSASDDADPDDVRALEAAARASAEANAAATAAAAAAEAAAAAAPHRAAVLVRFMLGMRASAPMTLLTAITQWRLGAWRRRAAFEHHQRVMQREEVQIGRAVRQLAEAHVLRGELEEAEEAFATSTAQMLQRVLDEREKRAAAERELRIASTPLAIQEQTSRLKKALELEVIARQAAEAKAARLQRSTAALDSQYRIASETASRLQRERRGAGAS